VLSLVLCRHHAATKALCVDGTMQHRRGGAGGGLSGTAADRHECSFVFL